jgi:hypothetical protein
MPNQGLSRGARREAAAPLKRNVRWYFAWRMKKGVMVYVTDLIVL